MNWSEDLIWKYIDGDCTPQEQDFMQEQLANNIGAKAQYQEILSIHNSLEDNVVITSPIDFTDTVMANLTPQRNPALNYLMRNTTSSFLPAALVVAVLAVLFGLYRSDLLDTSALGDVSAQFSGQTTQLVGVIVLCGLFFFVLDRLLNYLDMRKINLG